VVSGAELGDHFTKLFTGLVGTGYTGVCMCGKDRERERERERNGKREGRGERERAAERVRERV